MTKVRVCIVDDSITMRAMLGYMLEGQQDLEVVGVVEDTAETLAFIRRVRPDVVTIDATHGTDFPLLEELMEAWPVPVIVLTDSPDGGCPGGVAASKLGAVACFSKRAVGQDPAAFVKRLKKAATMKPKLRKDVLAA